MQTTTAECPYCGQIRTVMIPDGLDSKEELYCAQLEAIATCNCTQGAAARNKNKILQIAEDHIEDVLREAHPDAADLFQEAKEAVYDGRIRKLSVREGSGGKAELKRTKDGISVSYEKTNKTELST